MTTPTTQDEQDDLAKAIVSAVWGAAIAAAKSPEFQDDAAYERYRDNVVANGVKRITRHYTPNDAMAAEKLKARLVELDLLEQAINQDHDIYKFKMQRLDDLTGRLDALNLDSGTETKR